MRPYPMRFGTKRKTFSVFESSLNDFSNSDMVDLKREKSHNLIISQCLPAGYSWSRSCFKIYIYLEIFSSSGLCFAQSTFL